MFSPISELFRFSPLTSSHQTAIGKGRVPLGGTGAAPYSGSNRKQTENNGLKIPGVWGRKQGPVQSPLSSLILPSLSLYSIGWLLPEAINRKQRKREVVACLQGKLCFSSPKRLKLVDGRKENSTPVQTGCVQMWG